MPAGAQTRNRSGTAIRDIFLWNHTDLPGDALPGQAFAAARAARTTGSGTVRIDPLRCRNLIPFAFW